MNQMMISLNNLLMIGKSNELQLILILIVFYLGSIHGQSANLIKNGSLEGGYFRDGWEISSDLTSTNNPDQFCSPEDDIWNVNKIAVDGNCFTGLVVRDDGSNEKMIQKLKKPLIKGTKYSLSFFASMSSSMASISPKSKREKVSFGNPVSLEFYIGKRRKMGLLIFQVENILNTDWKEYIVEFTPTVDSIFFWFESTNSAAMFDANYNGNVFIDDIKVVEVN